MSWIILSFLILNLNAAEKKSPADKPPKSEAEREVPLTAEEQDFVQRAKKSFERAKYEPPFEAHLIDKMSSGAQK